MFWNFVNIYGFCYNWISFIYSHSDWRITPSSEVYELWEPKNSKKEKDSCPIKVKISIESTKKVSFLQIFQEGYEEHDKCLKNDDSAREQWWCYQK